jgi:hypothetical protein
LANLVVQAPYFVLVPILLRSQTGGDSAWAVALTCFSAGLILGAFLATRLRLSRPLLLIGPMIALEALPLLLLFTGAAWQLVAVSAALSAVAVSVLDVTWRATVQRQVPEHLASRLASIDAVGSFLLFPLGLIVALPLSKALGTDVVLGGAVVWSVAMAAVVTLLWGPKVRVTEEEPSRG